MGSLGTIAKWGRTFVPRCVNMGTIKRARTMKRIIVSTTLVALAFACGATEAQSGTQYGSQQVTYSATNAVGCTLGTPTVSAVNLTALTTLFSSSGVPANYTLSSANSPTFSVTCTAAGFTVSASSQNGGLTLGGLTYVSSNPTAQQTSYKVDYLMSLNVKYGSGVSGHSSGELVWSTLPSYNTSAATSVSSSVVSAIGTGGSVVLQMQTNPNNSSSTLPFGTYSDVVTLAVAAP
jgi:hypothetical protein